MIRNDNRMVKKGLFVSEVDARCCEYIYIFFFHGYLCVVVSPIAQ